MADACEVTVTRRVQLTAEVAVTPTFRCGPMRIACFDSRTVPGVPDPCPEEDSTCPVTVWQEILVEVPLRFGATARWRTGKVACT